MSAVTRRGFLQSAGLNAAGFAAPAVAAPDRPAAPEGPPKFRLGTVTYNVAAQWNLPTLLGPEKGTQLNAIQFTSPFIPSSPFVPFSLREDVLSRRLR
jgi:hypothetical protein